MTNQIKLIKLIKIKIKKHKNEIQSIIYQI